MKMKSLNINFKEIFYEKVFLFFQIVGVISIIFLNHLTILSNSKKISISSEKLYVSQTHRTKYILIVYFCYLTFITA